LEASITLFKNIIKGGKLAHAYLFAGPEGAGKRSTAKELAKALNCERASFDSCGECSSCRKIDKGIHPDVNWIAPEGAGKMIKIEKIRGLKSSINLTPYEGKIKVYIIDKAHKMNEEASNSLLKTLEEPPQNSILILISEKPETLLYTIKSRCQEMQFKSLQVEDILKDKNSIEWKNQVIDNFGKDNNNDGEMLKKEFAVLAAWYRDILVLKETGTEEFIINKDRIDDIKSEAKKNSQEELFNILDKIRESSMFVQQNVNPKLIINSFLTHR